MRHSVATLLLIIGWIPAVAAEGSSLEIRTRSLEEAVKTFEQHGSAFFRKVERLPTDDLRILRKAWLTQSRYRSLATKLNQTSDPEVAYRLARHAFVLRLDGEVAPWVARIPNRPETLEWQARGTYLLGTLALRKKETTAARDLFTKATAQGELSAPTVAASATIALARMLFDEGDYEGAKRLYAKVPKDTSPNYEDSLDESAWALLRTGRGDLASTNIDLLFALFPQSRHLPSAGYLLGKILESRENLAEGASVLERLSVRFAFEKEAAERALQAYSGHDEEILLEFEPTLPGPAPRAILPPIARSLIERDPAVRDILAELLEAHEQLHELKDGKALSEALRLTLEGSDGTTIESVTLHQWANALESQAVGAQPLESETLKALTVQQSDLSNVMDEADRSYRSLEEVDRHIWINWKTLGGEREQQALRIKTETREALRELDERRDSIRRQRIHLEALWLRALRRATREETLRLRSLRSSRPENQPLFDRLDALRAEVDAKERKRLPDLREQAKSLDAQLGRELADLQKLVPRQMRLVRGQIRNVLRENGIELAKILSLYRWSIAEARYKHLRAIEHEISDARRTAELSMNGLDEALRPLEKPVPNPSFDPDLAKLDPDAARFARAANEYVAEVEDRVRVQMERKRKGYSTFIKGREEALIDEQETRREQAIVSYQQVVQEKPSTDRTPFALYRLAQLQYERAEVLSALNKQSDPFKLATAPLERIEAEFPDFPHRDNTLYLLGYAYLEAKQPQASVGAFEKLVGQFPRSRLVPEIQLRIGEHYFGRKQFAKAIPHYQAVLGFGFNFFYDKALYKLAWCNYLTGRFDSAIAHFLILLDYSEALSEDQRKRFVEFADEAVEYVAFSLYRSGGVEAARSIFEKTGWKRYAEPVLIRMAKIYADRGDPRGALRTYGLAAERFTVSDQLPAILEARIRLYEQANDLREAQKEKERTVHLLDPKGDWRKQNENQPAALAASNQLLQRVLFSLATQVETEAATQKNRERLKDAELLYRRVIADYPRSREAYDAQYRLGDLAFQRGDYQDAVVDYDTVARNDRFGHHFSDALFGVVVCRDNAIKDRGGVDAVIARHDQTDVPPPMVENLVRAIDNFVKRSPRDRRVPEASFLLANVQTRIGRYDEAREAYLRVAERYPESPWAEQSLTAAIDTYMLAKKWNEAAELAAKTLREKTKASSEFRAKLVALEEGARFKAAEQLETSEPQKAVAGYLSFQKQYPASALAPKAVFNAFAISKREQRYNEALTALDLLIATYEEKPEAKGARFERAVLWDTVFELDKAVAAYGDAMKHGLSKEQERLSFYNSAVLLVAKDQKGNQIDALLGLADRAADPVRSDIDLMAAELSSKEASPRLTAIHSKILSRSTAPAYAKSKSAAALAGLKWEADEAASARGFETTASKAFRGVEKERRQEAQIALAQSLALHIAHDRRQLADIRIDARNVASLAASFKKRVRLLAQLERSTVDLIALQSVRASARGLYELGLAYQVFSKDLESTRVPAAEELEFKKILPSLTEPLKNKAKDTFNKAFTLLSDARLPEAYFPGLIDSLVQTGVTFQKASNADLQWAEGRLPSPQLLSLPPPAPKVTALFRLPLLAAVPPAPTFDREGAIEQFQKGLDAAAKMDSADQRARAIESFGNALLKDPTFAEALYNLTVVQLFDGQKAGVDLALSRLGRSNLLNPAARLRLSVLASLLRGEGSRASVAADELAKLEPTDEENRWRHVVALLMAGKRTEAVAKGREFLAERPRSILAHRALSAAFRMSKEFNSARILLERALVLEPKNPKVMNELALSLIGSDFLARRGSLFKAAAEAGDPEGMANWANLAFQVHRYRDALLEWQKASTTSGKNHPAIEINLSLAARQIGESP